MPAPRKPTAITVAAGPVQLSALDYGSPDAPAMVLLHGHADLAWSMDSVAQAFCGSYHVVSLDLRGHGNSPHPGAYSIPHFLADLAATVRSLDLDAPVLIAHSLGGHVATQYAGLFPTDVSRLVLVEGLGPPAQRATGDDARDAFTRASLELLSTPLHHRPLADVEAAAARLAAVHPRLDPDRALFLASVGTVPGPDGGRVWSFDPRTRDWIASVDHIETERLWRAVRCPVLVVNGACSWEEWWAARLSPVSAAEGRTRLSAQEWADRIAQFRDVSVVDIDDAGHLVHYDQPERLNEVIAEFLQRRSNG